MRRNLLITVVLRVRLLQFASISEERPLPALVVRQVHFRIFRRFLRQPQRIRRRDDRFHPLPVLVALPSPIPATAADGKPRDTHSGAASGSTAPACPRVLHFLAQVVALVPVQFPRAKDGGPRLYP